jgi:hypothetical protein
MLLSGSEFSRRGVCFCARVVGLVIPLVFSTGGSLAQDGVSSKDFWVGANVSEEMWLAFSGGTIAPFGSLHEEGFRLRAIAGYGEYDTGTQIGSVMFQDALLGYQTKVGSLTIAGYAGLAAIHREYVDLQVLDADTLLITWFDGTEWGAKGALDLWYDDGGAFWASLNTSYTTAFNTHSLRGRVGWKAADGLSLGPELSFDDNSKDEIQLDAGYQRAGLFARYNWAGGEISISGGLSREADDTASPYATLGFYTHY